MADRLDDVEEIFERHARRLARELGGMIVEVGEALRRAAETESWPTPTETETAPEETREDLYREATRLGIRGRSKMTKKELRDAIRRAKAR
jgi:hypothetical protein